MTDQTSAQPVGNDVATEWVRTMIEDAEWQKAHPWKAAVRRVYWSVGELLWRLTGRRAAGRHAAR